MSMPVKSASVILTAFICFHSSPEIFFSFSVFYIKDSSHLPSVKRMVCIKPRCMRTPQVIMSQICAVSNPPPRMIYSVPRSHISSPPHKIRSISDYGRGRTIKQRRRQNNCRRKLKPRAGISACINPTIIKPSVIVPVISVNISLKRRIIIRINPLPERKSKTWR